MRTWQRMRGSVVLSAMPAYLRVSLAAMFQYRGEMALWALWGVVYPIVAMAMWSAAVEGSESGSTIEGYTQRDMAGYFLLTMIVGHVCTAWDIYEMGGLVRSGRMSPRLLRPILPIWQAISDNLAYKVLTLAILIPLWAVVAAVTRPSIEPGFWHVPAGVLASLLGAGLNFIWGYTLALAAFWVTKADAVGQLWFGASLFLGGRMAPLEILPVPLQFLANALPFKWVVWFPSAALMGKVPATSLLPGLAMQVFWLVAGIVLFRFAWQAAVKRYSAVGA